MYLLHKLCISAIIRFLNLLDLRKITGDNFYLGQVHVKRRSGVECISVKPQESEKIMLRVKRADLFLLYD